ncbi:MAG TPA: ABC transporter permease [Vicinamibacterales bacterium]|nr:ABC transporter permease [Vicinamibacterales bacterium]
MTRPFLALVRKDLRLFFLDRRAVIFSVLAPIAFASFFGYVFSGGEQRETGRVTVLLVDGDDSVISRDIAGRLSSDQALAVRAVSEEQARESVRGGRAAVAVNFPPGFGDAAARAFFGADAKAPLVLMYDPSRSTEASMVEGILTGHVMQAVSRELFTGPTGREVVDDALAQLEGADDMRADERDALQVLLRGVARWNDLTAASGSDGEGDAGMTVPFETRREAVMARTGMEYNAYAHSFAGISVQFILFMGIDMGVGLLLLRQQGLWQRLRAAPLSRAALLGSRAVSTALLSLFILFAMFLFAFLVFGVKIEGSVLGFLGIALAFSLMTAAFGLVIAGFGKTPEGTRGLAIVATLLLVMLGGAWVPTFVFPSWLQTLTLVVPTRWAVDGLDAVLWRGLGLSAVAWQIAALAGSALLFGAISVARFRWEE